MSDVDKALRVHTALVKAGVDPEYARVQVQHRADALSEADPEMVTADILSNTPTKYITRKPTEEGTEPEPPAYDPVAAGRAMAAKERKAVDSRDAFR